MSQENEAAENEERIPEPPGGWGELPDSLRPYGSGQNADGCDRETLILIQKALKYGWAIPPELKAYLVLAQFKDAVDEEGSPRSRAAATRTLVSMEQQNIVAASQGVNETEEQKIEVGGGDLPLNEITRQMAARVPFHPEPEPGEEDEEQSEAKDSEADR